MLLCNFRLVGYHVLGKFPKALDCNVPLFASCVRGVVSQNTFLPFQCKGYLCAFLKFGFLLQFLQKTINTQGNYVHFLKLIPK